MNQKITFVCNEEEFAESDLIKFSINTKAKVIVRGKKIIDNGEIKIIQ